MKNKYVNRSKVSETVFRKVVNFFAIDLTAAQCAELTKLNINTVERFYNGFRERIAELARAMSPIEGEVEIDESYFGARRVQGKRGRGAGGKTIVFGLFKRNGNVYTEIVKDCKKATLQAVIRGKVDISSIIHTDGWGGYDGLVDLGYKKHFRVEHGNNEFSKGNGNHINGIESFWGYAKHRLTKFKGIPKNRFYIYLKETEFRFNMKGGNLYLFLLKELRNRPLF